MLKIKRLRTDHQEEPLGVDTPTPCFSWHLDSDGKNIFQSGYQITVCSGTEVFWDSGRVNSEECIGICYKGKPLLEQEVYSILLTVWSSEGEQARESAGFETAFFTSSGFSAEWISCDPEDSDSTCPVFRKEFPCRGDVRRARLYSSACGVYDVVLNDQKVGNSYLAPGWTNYHERIQYQISDITPMLTDQNRIDITVAPGWYSGDFGGEGRTKNYGDKIAAFAEIHIWYEDGRKEAYHTGDSWRWGTGPVLYSEIYHGETVDNRRVSECTRPVRLFEMDNSRLIAQQAPPVRIMRYLDAKELIVTPKGETVIDFGQNLSGFVELNIVGTEGREILLQHGEVLDRDGNFYRENLRTAKAADKFICKEGAQIFSPRFTFHGFRYVKVDGWDGEPPLSAFRACVLYSDMEETAEFRCSNPLVNKLWSNIRWGMDGNFVDIPTDCPQRDERLGWTGDATAFIGTAAHLHDVYLFFRKWLKDLESQQSDEFGVPHMIPNIMGDHGGAAMWSDSATIIPWTLYQVYGDAQIIEAQYDSMKRWVEFMRRQETPGHLRKTGHQYGDWLALDKEEFSTRPMGATDPYFIATAFYAYSTDILAKAAAILGYGQDEKTYRDLYEKIRKGFREEYVTATGRLVGETQTACILALKFDLVQEEFRDKIRNALVDNINAHKGHLTTGFIGTPFAAHALSISGAHEIAGKLLLNEDYPGWLNEVKLGATTIWERWNSMMPDGSFDESGMNSFNHYAFGSIGSWMIEELAGIKILEAGYKKTSLQPKFIQGMNEVSVKRLTPYGRLACSWKCKNGEIHIEVTVPANTSAILELPDKNETVSLGSGTHVFSYGTTLDIDPKRFSLDSPLAELLDDPAGKGIVEKYMPGITENSMVGFLKKKTINELISMSQGSHSVNYLDMIKEMNDIAESE